MTLNRTILQGDVLEKLVEIPDGVIDTIISSPPYWRLRDYGVEGQLGLEPDFRDYLKIMGKIMDQLKRVLKSTGTCWINLGDSYWGGGRGPDSFERKGLKKDWSDDSVKHQHTAQTQAIWETGLLPPKTRIGIPERFYIQCIDDGWIARNHIPWYKSNSMPSSVKDRFTNKWESIFFFAKAQKYYFNLDAVREKTITESKPFNIRVRENITGHAQAKLGDKSWTASDEEMKRYNKDGTIKEREGNQNNRYTNEKLGHRNGLGKSTLDNKQDTTLGADGKPIPTYVGFNDRWKVQNQHNVMNPDADSEGYNSKGKNPGDVFFINPRPFPEAHFATFPVDLPLKILKCACPPIICSSCGHPQMNNPNKLDSSANTHGEELLQELSQKDSSQRRSLQGEEILLDKMLQSNDRQTKTKKEYEQQGLSTNLAEREICPRTQIDNGKKIRKEITSNGSNSSHQRNKNRQSHSELDLNDQETTRSTIQTTTQTDSMSLLSEVDETRFKCEKCGSHDSHPGIVLDCFFGAGTVGVAAEMLGLQWCGIELNEEYITIARNRLEPYLNNKLEVFT